MSTRQGVNTIIPGRLFQRGQFLTWTYNQKHSLLNALAVDTVINLWHRVDPDLSPSTYNRLYINWHISPSHMPLDADLMVAFLVDLLSTGRHLLVHCEAGRGRSVWLSARLLAVMAGISRAEALARVKEAVGAVSLHGPLLEDLR